MKIFLPFVIGILLLASAHEADAAVTTNSLIKLSCPSGAAVDHLCKAVYYYGSDSKRHAFPNDKVYFTWYSDFSTVQTVSSDVMTSFPLGTNVTYHPGVRMVKFATLAKVYAVSKNGLLRWVATEEIARLLYGSAWNQKIDDVSDIFFTNYTFGTDITSTSDYSPTTETTSVSTIDGDKELSAPLPPVARQGDIVWQMKGVDIDVPLEDMQAIYKAGIEVLTTEWGIEEGDAKARAFLDRANSAGLKAVMDGGFSEAAWGYDYDKGISSNQLPVWQEALVKDWVSALKDHPALFGWDISNEDGENFTNGFGSPLWPDKSSLTIEQLKRANATVKAIDPKHPVLLRMHYWDPSPNPFGPGNWFARGIADVVMLNLYSNFAEDRKTPNLPDMILEHGQRHLDDVRRVDSAAKIWIALAAFEGETQGGYFLRPKAQDLQRDIKASKALMGISGIGLLQWGPQKYAKPYWYLPRDGGDLLQVIQEEIKTVTNP